MGHGFALVATGLGVGLALTLVLSRFLEPTVTRISARDPGTIAIAAVAVVVAGIAATLVPARHALRIDPVDALRDE